MNSRIMPKTYLLKTAQKTTEGCICHNSNYLPHALFSLQVYNYFLFPITQKWFWHCFQILLSKYYHFLDMGFPISLYCPPWLKGEHTLYTDTDFLLKPIGTWNKLHINSLTKYLSSQNQLVAQVTCLLIIFGFDDLRCVAENITIFFFFFDVSAWNPMAIAVLKSRHTCRELFNIDAGVYTFPTCMHELFLQKYFDRFDGNKIKGSKGWNWF